MTEATNIFANVPDEGEEIKIEDAVEKTTEGSQPEPKTPDNKPGKTSEEGEHEDDNTPSDKKYRDYRDHPRFKNLLKFKQEAEVKLKDWDEKWKGVEPLLNERKLNEAPLPDWWKSYYGEDVKAKEQYQLYLKNTEQERSKLKEDVLKEFTEEQNKQSQAVEKANEYVQTEIESMKDEGINFNENELMKFMLDYEKEWEQPIVDKNGNYDFRKGLRLMEKMNPKPEDTSTDLKKKIAGDAMKTKVKPQTNSPIPIVSRKALGPNGSWRDAEQSE